MSRTQVHHTNERFHLPEPLDHLINTDGESHPLLNTMMLATVVLAVVSLVCLADTGWYVVGMWAGLVGIPVGLVAQFFSATRGERWVIIPATIACAFAFLMNVNNGGLL